MAYLFVMDRNVLFQVGSRGKLPPTDFTDVGLNSRVKSHMPDEIANLKTFKLLDEKISKKDARRFVMSQTQIYPYLRKCFVASILLAKVRTLLVMHTLMLL